MKQSSILGLAALAAVGYVLYKNSNSQSYGYSGSGSLPQGQGSYQNMTGLRGGSMRGIRPGHHNSMRGMNGGSMRGRMHGV